MAVSNRIFLPDSLPSAEPISPAVFSCWCGGELTTSNYRIPMILYMKLNPVYVKFDQRNYW
jgi:hypothetical protein